jgi:hypothetical protein
MPLMVAHVPVSMVGKGTVVALAEAEARLVPKTAAIPPGANSCV